MPALACRVDKGAEHSWVPSGSALSWESGGLGSRLFSATNQWHVPVSQHPRLRNGNNMTSFLLNVKKEFMRDQVKTCFEK